MNYKMINKIVEIKNAARMGTRANWGYDGAWQQEMDYILNLAKELLEEIQGGK